MAARPRRSGVVVLTTGDDPGLLLMGALLSQALAVRGLRSHAAGVESLREQGETLTAWTARRRPDVVVCLLGPPYEAGWRTVAPLSRNGTRMLLLVADPTAARSLAGRAEVCAIAGGIDELDTILARVEALVPAPS